MESAIDKGMETALKALRQALRLSNKTMGKDSANSAAIRERIRSLNKK